MPTRAHSTRSDVEDAASSPLVAEGLRQMLDWSANVTQVMVDAGVSWQRALIDMNQELWDEWVVRFASGAAIDE